MLYLISEPNHVPTILCDYPISDKTISIGATDAQLSSESSHALPSMISQIYETSIRIEFGSILIAGRHTICYTHRAIVDDL